MTIPPPTSTLAAFAGAQPFLVVTGKGGVGKSVVAASLGQVLAKAGRRVLVIEVDPRENVHQLFGVPPSGGHVVAIDHNLHLQNLKPRQALDELVRRHLGSGLVARQILKSETYHQLSEGAPGLREVGVLDYAVGRTTARGEDRLGPFDVVVLDAPATGHGVSLLAAPKLVSEVVASGPVGEKAAELAAFLADPRRLAAVVVTLAEEMPVDEALELRRSMLERLGHGPDLLVVNGLYPPLSAALAKAKAGDEAALGVWRQRRAVNDRELRRLADHWQGPRVELPLFALEPGPALVAALAPALAGALGRGEA